MNDTSTGSVTAAHLEVADARLYYEVRGHGPLLVLVGAPMDARTFASMADVLASDYTVLTTDPRGINRSTVTDPDRDSTPEMRADDLARLIAHLDVGPAAVLGSSGGAVSALALVQAHPERVHTAIAHEPPLHDLVADRAELHRQTDDMISTYLAGDVLGAWARFMAAANIQMPPQVIEAMFGGERDAQTVADERYQFTHMLRATSWWQPDIAALRAAPTRIVVGIGEESSGQFCDRSSTALAAALGIDPTIFPGGHIGFTQDPARFADRLRAVLAEADTGRRS